jgi:fido (protein-threonine AMPylation protein)
MVKDVYIACLIVNDKHQTKSGNINAKSVNPLLYKVQDEFWEFIKKEFLAHSIHKGQFLGFRDKGGRLFSIDQLFVFCMSELETLKKRPVFNIEIAHANIDFEMIRGILHEKRATLSRIKQSLEKRTKVNEKLSRDFTYSSNKIEGNMMTIEEVDEVLQNQKDAKSGDQIEMVTHYNLVLSILKNPPKVMEITEDIIKRYHSEIQFASLTKEKCGVYRTKKVMVRGSDHKFCAPEQVPTKMANYIQWIQEQDVTVDNAIAIAVEAHYRLVNIHPFSDGNGRICRIVMNLVLMQIGYPLTSIHFGIRKIYFESLSMIDENQDHSLLERIVAEACIRSMDIVLFEQ